MSRDKPWHDRATMYELYVEQKKSASQISDHFDNQVTPRTISHWLNKLDIPIRSAKEARILATLRSRKPCFYTDNFGYERWETRYRNKKYVVKVHRLLAVAEYGFDAVAGENDVHHKNGIKWDNRPENIQVLSKKEHNRLHFHERDDIGNEIGLIAQHGAEAVLGPDEAYGSKEGAEAAKNTLVAEVGPEGDGQ